MIWRVNFYSASTKSALISDTFKNKQKKQVWLSQNAFKHFEPYWSKASRTLFNSIFIHIDLLPELVGNTDVN